MNGTSIPNTIKKLNKEKNVTVFVDGDRGGDLIIKELQNYLPFTEDFLLMNLQLLGMSQNGKCQLN